MIDDDLPAIAEKAINGVLRYHDQEHTGITALQRDIINGRIAELLPLKSFAADPDTANIEIVADAAMSCLDLYNLEHRDNTINERWMYIGVQSLASIDLKPTLVCGTVPRIPDAPPESEPAPDSPGADSHEIPQHDQIDDNIGNDSRTIKDEFPVAAASKRGSSTQDEPDPASDDDDGSPPVKTTPRAKKRRSNGPQAANGKDPWGDEEIKKLIKWKAQGMTHKKVGALLGRTEPACAIRHSIVLKQDKWVNFSREYREKRAAGEDSDVEGENEVGEEGEQVEDDEETGKLREQKVAEQIMEITEMSQDEEGDHRE